MKKYKTIVADPPWKYGTWGKASIPRSKTHIPKDEPMPYETMSIEEIKALNVASLADKNCELYLWTTQKYLPDAFEVLKAWGFKYLGDITIDEYNSLYEYKEDDYIDPDSEKKPGAWDTLTGILTKAEADVVDCIYFRKMTWNETSEHLGVAQSTCWFRKNRAIKKIFSAFEGMDGLISDNIKLLLREDNYKLNEFSNGQ